MNDPNSFGYRDTTAGPGGMERPQSPLGPGPGAANHSMGQMQLSPEETRVLQECNRTAFFSRSLPLGASLGLATAVAVQQVDLSQVRIYMGQQLISKNRSGFNHQLRTRSLSEPPVPHLSEPEIKDGTSEDDKPQPTDVGVPSEKTGRKVPNSENPESSSAPMEVSAQAGSAQDANSPDEDVPMVPVSERELPDDDAPVPLDNSDEAGPAQDLPDVGVPSETTGRKVQNVVQKDSSSALMEVFAEAGSAQADSAQDANSPDECALSVNGAVIAPEMESSDEDAQGPRDNSDQADSAIEPDSSDENVPLVPASEMEPPDDDAPVPLDNLDEAGPSQDLPDDARNSDESAETLPITWHLRDVEDFDASAIVRRVSVGNRPFAFLREVGLSDGNHPPIVNGGVPQDPAPNARQDNELMPCPLDPHSDPRYRRAVNLLGRELTIPAWQHLRSLQAQARHTARHLLIASASGYLKPNARFGAIPKVTMAVIVGYFVGKLSYQQACAEKLMALPGSYIGQLLRDRRDGKVGGSDVIHNQAPGTMYGATASDIYSDAGPGNSLDLDSDRAGQVFSEDLTRPESGVSDTPTLAPAQTPSRPVLSYDELRRKNRGDHVDAKQDPYRVDPQSAPIVTRRAMPRPVPPSTNAYGDVLE